MVKYQVNLFNSGKESYVRVIKGRLKADGKFSINKLDEYKNDEKVIKSILYDVYSNKNELIAGKPVYASKIIKTYPDGSVRYSILDSNDTSDNMGLTVISFDKLSIKNQH